MSSKKIVVQVWSNNQNTWEHLRCFDTMASANACVRNWQRGGYKARIVEA